MPVTRYFLLVGGALLLLLLVTGVWLPSLPAIERAEAPRATIRIHSGMKLPERVVFDTSTPTVTAAMAPVVAAPSAPPASFAEDVSAKARQALAQLQSSDSSKAKVAEVKVKSSQSRKNETRKRAAAPRKIRLARQPQFDWFSGRMWW